MEKAQGKIKISSILCAKCPSCHQASVLEGVFAIRKHCPVCDYDLYPEPGFYLGAMVVGFFLTAVLTIPPLIVMKALNVDIRILLAFPFVEFLFIGTFLMFYSRILWLHVEFRMTAGLDGGRRAPSKR